MQGTREGHGGQTPLHLEDLLTPRLQGPHLQIPITGQIICISNKLPGIPLWAPRCWVTLWTGKQVQAKRAGRVRAGLLEVLLGGREEVAPPCIPDQVHSRKSRVGRA